MKELTEKEALNKAAAYCSTAEHCTSEVRAKLEAWGIDEDTQEAIIARLTKEKFISDSRYALSYARDKMRFAGWGKIKIAMMLRTKDIDRELIQEAVSALDEDEYAKILSDILKNKMRGLKYKTDYEKRFKLMRYAAGRGFEPSLISKCLGTTEEYDDF